MVRFRLISQELLKIETDLIVVFLFNDLIPLKGNAGYLDWILNGHISDLIKGKKVFGIFKETVLLSTSSKIPAEKILLIGFGKTVNLNSPKLINLYSYLMKILKHIDVKDFGISLDFPTTSNISDYKLRVNNVMDGIINGFRNTNESDEDYIIRMVEKDESRFSLLRNTVHTALRRSNWKSMAVLE